MKEMRKRKNKEKAKGWNEKTNQGNGNKHKEQNEQIRVIRKQASYKGRKKDTWKAKEKWNRRRKEGK